MIREAIASAIEEATYPEGFDVATFKNLPSFKARLAYVKERLPKIAQGSARAVFVIDDVTVLKVAMNEKGLAQNEVEADIGRYSDSYPVAKVFEVGDNGAWLEMEKAVKAKPNDFKKLAGMSIQDFANIISFWKANQSGRRVGWAKPMGYDDYVESGDYPFINSVLALMADYDMPAGDIGRISSWGVVNRGRPELVLIDFGLTSTVYNDFYAPKTKPSNYSPPPTGYYPWGEKIK